MRPFLLGLLAAFALLALVAFGTVQMGAVPARGDVAPGMMEKWAANTSLKAVIAREAPQPPYPYGPPTVTDLVQGAKLYAQNCAVCHGAGTGNPTAIARGFSVKAPQFGKHGVDDDPEGETYWKVEHGIRFTGMPAFGKSLDEKSIWQITYFLKNQPHLPPQAKAIFDHPNLAPSPTPAPALANGQT